MVNRVVALFPTLAPLASDAGAVASDAHAASDDSIAARSPMELTSNKDCSMKLVHEASAKLVLAAPVIKKRVLNAAAIAVNIDGYVTLREAELLRTVADSLDCPMPPLNVE